MRAKKYDKRKPDPRLEVLLERLMDAAPSSDDPPEAVADPSLAPFYEDREGTIKPETRSDIKPETRSDSLLEDIIEVLDPTGISSWDDASRAYDSYTARVKNTGKYVPTMDEFLDVVGTIPALGKLPKGAKLVRGASETALRVIKKQLKSRDVVPGFISDRTE